MLEAMCGRWEVMLGTVCSTLGAQSLCFRQQALWCDQPRGSDHGSLHRGVRAGQGGQRQRTPSTTPCSRDVPPPPRPGSPQVQEDLAVPQCGLTPALPRLLCYSWGHPQPRSLQTGTEQSPGQGQPVCWGHARRVTPQERTSSLSGSSHIGAAFARLHCATGA